MKNLLVLGTIVLISLSSCRNERQNEPQSSEYSKEYKGEFLNRIAFPIGGMGAGMFCLEGTGAISNMSDISPTFLMNLVCLLPYT